MILSVARDQFLSIGYARTTMEAVAQVAGVSKGTLYARYGDKAALFEAVVSERLDAWQSSRSFNPHSGEGDLSTHLRDFGREFLTGIREPEASAFHRLLAAETGRFPELAKAFYMLGFQRAVSRLKEAIDSVPVPAGSQRIDTSAVALAFNSALLGWVDSQRMISDVSDEQCDLYLETLVEIFSTGWASAELHPATSPYPARRV